MTSKKRAKKTSSNYLISIGRNDYSKSSSNIIGKLRANFLGTEFQIYDAGKNPKHLDSFFDEKNYDEPRCELGAILYSSNIIGNRGPRKMQVCINRVSEHGECVKRWQPAVKDEEMLECFKAKNETARKHLLIYENRQPKWNEDIGSYVLNFDKRVSLASVKNFQLIDPTSSNGKVLMQFGKKGQDEFIMDVQYPLSLFQAFAVSLSSCDSKLGVD
jgi:tubby-related protein 1